MSAFQPMIVRDRAVPALGHELVFDSGFSTRVDPLLALEASGAEAPVAD